MDKDVLYRLAEEYRDSSPIIVIDHKKIRENYKKFVTALPRVHPYYAVKANPEPEIIRTLYNLGSGYDVASLEEYTLVDNMALGTVEEVNTFMEDRVIYANPIKTPKSLKKIEMKKMQMTFDNFRELDKIKQYCKNPRLVLRLCVPNEGAIVELSSKFGADPDTANDLLSYAKTLGFTVEGVSFHVGSQCENYQNYVRAFEISRAVFDHAEDIGLHLKTLDIGGGYPVTYNGKNIEFEELATVINHQIDKHFNAPDMDIIAEPGRFLVANAAYSVVQIMGKAVRFGRPYYYVNDGVYGTFSGQIYDHVQYHFKSFKDGPLTPTAVAGPTCDGLDTVVKDDPLPELDLGDFLYSENVGAYTNGSASHFNGFVPARIININTK